MERQGAGDQPRRRRARRLTAAPGDRYARGVPLYEYRCRTCDERFELRRPMSDSDLATPCPDGHDDTVRLLSMFGVQTGAIAGPAPAGVGGGCCGGACGCRR